MNIWKPRSNEKFSIRSAVSPRLQPADLTLNFILLIPGSGSVWSASLWQMMTVSASATPQTIRPGGCTPGWVLSSRVQCPAGLASATWFYPLTPEHPRIIEKISTKAGQRKIANLGRAVQQRSVFSSSPKIVHATDPYSQRQMLFIQRLMSCLIALCNHIHTSLAHRSDNHNHVQGQAYIIPFLRSAFQYYLINALVTCEIKLFQNSVGG